MSGKQSHYGVPRCPYKHPSICSKLLRHGDRGRGGCRGKEAGCKEFHQVKMCFNSMNTKQCINLKDCSNGYHVKGTVATKEGKKESPNEEKKEKEKEKESLQEKEGSNMASFLGQLLLSQQEMKKQQDQQWLHQQQMMNMFMAKLGGLESRPSSPMQGVQGMPGMLMPSMAQVVGGYRPVA